MKIIPFEKLYNTEFLISEPMAKSQYWYHRGNVYNAIGMPKVSHTLLWFKNCSGIITDKSGKIMEMKQNQVAYMAKGTEYKVEFFGTKPDSEDTVVIHFQMTDVNGEDIAPVMKPIVVIKEADLSLALAIELMAEEFKKNVVCIPLLKAEIYKLLVVICQKQKRRSTRNKYTCIRPGIELLEQNSDMKITDIAQKCGVSECYFRRLFTEYSGENPKDFRQRHRIEKAKQLLLSDEHLTVGEIAEELKFSDIYHFSKTFKKYCNMSPSSFVAFKEKKPT